MARPGAQHQDGDLGAVAAELYALRPNEFTAARDRQAADARRAGDAQLSASIKKLSRPSAAAWLANLLVRRSPERVAGLLDVGAALREAQASLARDAIRQLGEEGRRAVAALMSDARRTAGELGQPVSGAVALELEGTLKAALADTDAAEALTRGQLTVALRYAGLGPAGLSAGAAMTTGPAQATPSPRPRMTGPEGLEKDSQVAPAAAGHHPGRPGEAESRLRKAQDALAQAQVRAHERDRQATEARRHLEGFQVEASDLEARLRELRKAEARAEGDLCQAEAERDAATLSVAEAEERVTEAQSVITRVIPGS